MNITSYLKIIYYPIKSFLFSHFFGLLSETKNHITILGTLCDIDPRKINSIRFRALNFFFSSHSFSFKLKPLLKQQKETSNFTHIYTKLIYISDAAHQSLGKKSFTDLRVYTRLILPKIYSTFNGTRVAPCFIPMWIYVYLSVLPCLLCK